MNRERGKRQRHNRGRRGRGRKPGDRGRIFHRQRRQWLEKYKELTGVKVKCTESVEERPAKQLLSANSGVSKDI